MEKHAIMNKLSLQTGYENFQNADMVIEAVFEDMNVKHAVVKEVEQHVPESCVIATNTSALSITEIAKASKRPEKIVGMHYFFPVDKMQLSEIIRLLQEGVSPTDLNKAAQKYGFPVGLATLMDEVGIDVAGTVGTYLANSYGARLEGGDTAMFQAFIDKNILGKKTGKGMFLYEGKKMKNVGINPDAQEIINQF